MTLNVPEPIHNRLSFCEPDADSLNQWVKRLPMAHIGETARRLYQALNELNTLRTGPGRRYQLLEILRPPVYYACAALSRHYLGQHSAPEKQEQIAELTQTLQNQLATGYKLVIQHTLQHKDRFPPQAALKLCAGAIHRALTELSQTVLRSCQLYCAPPDHIWHELHWLYRLAERLRLADLRLQDTERQYRTQASITDIYKQVLMLACARPNQLRQQDLASVYRSLELWCGCIQLVAADAEDALFVFDSNGDAPPSYRLLRDHQPLPAGPRQAGPRQAGLRGIKCDALVAQLRQYLAHQKEQSAPPTLTIPDAVGTPLAIHLVYAWSRPAKRSHTRTPASGSATLCVGLTPVHYFVGGRQPFSLQLSSGNQRANAAGNPFLTPRAQQGTSATPLGGPIYEDDVWAAAFDTDRNPSALPLDDAAHSVAFTPQTPDGDAEQAPTYDTYTVQLIDVSPGGYCLEWRQPLPAKVRTGELIGIKERDNAAWLVGVVRWVRQLQEQVTRMGIELLAPHAIACGVKLVQKTGGHSEYMRGLLLPEMKVLGLPASLITPTLPFRSGHKVVINQHGKEARYKLNRLLAAPGEFQQFEIAPLGQAAPRPTGGAQFDSLWKRL